MTRLSFVMKLDYLGFLIGVMVVVIVVCLQALSKALTEDELVYLRAQFMLLEPNQDGRLPLDNFKMVIYFSRLFTILLLTSFGLSKVEMIANEEFN